MPTYVLCDRNTRQPCDINGNLLSWPLANGAVVVEEFEVMPILESDTMTFLLMAEIDPYLDEDVWASPSVLASRYDRKIGLPWPYPDEGLDFRALHDRLQDAYISALITTESLFGSDAIAA